MLKHFCSRLQMSLILRYEEAGGVSTSLPRNSATVGEK